MYKNYTLVICRRTIADIDGSFKGQILLGMKKRGFGIDKFNGFGGKLEPGETMRAAAHRELEEESSLVASELIMRGLLLFYMKNSKLVMNVGVYECNSFDGIPTESDEMIPQWFDADKVPLERMWPDDQYWIPMFLANRSTFIGR